MSSKSAKEKLCTALSLLPSKSWSIASRMRTLYALAAAIIFTLSSVILYWGLVKTVEQQTDNYINDEINVIQTILKTPDGMTLLAHKLATASTARGFMKTYSRILNPAGQVVLQTSQMEDIIPETAFPSHFENDKHPEKITWRAIDGKPYLLRSQWITNYQGTETQRKLQIALDVSYFEQILADFRELLLSVVIIGTMISAWLSSSIARRGMRPLQEMADRTRQITTNNLDQRISMPYCPNELKHLASSFDAMLESLQDSFERLSNNVNNMAHELRTPINVLIGEAEVALSKDRTAPEYRKVIESSLEECDGLSRMIDSLLFIARADIGTSQLKQDRIEVNPAISKVVDYYQPLADDKGIFISCTGDAWLHADPTLFRRAVSNILSNALHYTPSQGTISIAIRQLDDLSATITFSDTGCGISKEDLPNVFDRFYRVDATKDKHLEGTGLGLAIVKSVMELHGGSCVITSEPSQGTTVTLSFPAANRLTTGS